LNRPTPSTDQGSETLDAAADLTMRPLLLALALSGSIASGALACDPTNRGGAAIPPLAAALGQLLPTVGLSNTDAERVAELRARIRELATAGKVEPARVAEEQAMRILGYRKAWLACGPGTFMWMRV
jgi:hypothetical protein